jgi:5-methyltetrahydropteroyltriglutamate--homocysteine methyltransferase
MVELTSTTPGLYPLPDDTKELLADLKGHQKSDLITGDEGPEVTSAYDDARERVVGRQAEAGLDRLVEGQLRWDDMLAHPLAINDAVETRGIVRYYDNNNFYREPVITGELTPTGDMAADLEALVEAAPEDAALQAVVPGPYSLADLATDEHYGEGLLDAVAELLVGEIERFPDVATLFLLEPSLATAPPADPEAASAALDRVAGATDADSVAFPYFGALTEETYVHLLDADLTAVGFDLVTEQETSLYNVNEYGCTDEAALGLVDGQNTQVESPDLLRERVDWFRENTPGAEFERLYLTSNTELFYLPVNRFEAKLDALAAATREVTA